MIPVIHFFDPIVPSQRILLFKYGVGITLSTKVSL